MTQPNPQDSHVLLILGEVRGDVKGIVQALSSLDARLASVEASTDARLKKLEDRVAALEAIKSRIGALAVGVGLAAGATAESIPKILTAIIGG